MPDKYDRAVELLLAANDFQHAVEEAWFDAKPDSPTGCLFQFVTESGKADPISDNTGCLTMIRSNTCYVAPTPDLTAAIRADTRLPLMVDDIRPHHLPIFAEWQRRLDRELRNRPDPDQADACIIVTG